MYYPECGLLELIVAKTNDCSTKAQAI